MTPEQAFALLEQEPYKTMFEHIKRQWDEGKMGSFLVCGTSSRKTEFRRALSIWRAIHRPQDVASQMARLYEFIKPVKSRRAQIRLQARARKNRRGWR